MVKTMNADQTGERGVSFWRAAPDPAAARAGSLF
jgi:hypothetical protein